MSAWEACLSLMSSSCDRSTVPMTFASSVIISGRIWPQTIEAATERDRSHPTHGTQRSFSAGIATGHRKTTVTRGISSEAHVGIKPRSPLGPRSDALAMRRVRLFMGARGGAIYGRSGRRVLQPCGERRLLD